MNEKFICQSSHNIESRTSRSSLACDDTRSSDEIGSTSRYGLGYHSVVIPFDVGESGIPGGSINLRHKVGDTVSFPIRLELVRITIGEARVGIECRGGQGIHGFPRELGSSRIEDVYDHVSDGPLSPEKSSGVGDREKVVGVRIGTGFDVGDIETFGEASEIRDSGGVTGIAGKTRERNKYYSSEYNENGDDDDELDESESPHPDLLPERERGF